MSRYLTYKQIINQCFNFQYAGKAIVFIDYSRAKYVVCSSGFEIWNDFVSFKKETCYVRKKFDDLENAIYCFNYLVRCLCETTDWFKPEMFEPKNIKELNKNCVY